MQNMIALWLILLARKLTTYGFVADNLDLAEHWQRFFMDNDPI
jgi:hypothetical protein